MTSTEATASPLTQTRTVQVYRVYIKAAPQKIWDAITQPEWNRRFGYGAPGEYDLRPGGAFRSTPSDAMRKASADMGWDIPDVIADGEVVESDPPNKLVQTWRMLMDPTTASEKFSTLTYEITPQDKNGVSMLTVTHDLTGAPATATMVAGDISVEAGGGWNWVLDDLKTLLETGTGFAE